MPARGWLGNLGVWCFKKRRLGALRRSQLLDIREWHLGRDFRVEQLQQHWKARAWAVLGVIQYKGRKFGFRIAVRLESFEGPN